MRSYKIKLHGCIVWNAQNTVFGSKRSAWYVAHSGHLNLETQTTFWDGNVFLRQRRHFMEPDRKIPEFNGVPKEKL